MLVLARKLHQSILVGDTIRITVLEVRDGQVRLGIDAPREMSVVRGEVLQAAVEANREAAARSMNGQNGVKGLVRSLLSPGEGVLWPGRECV